MVGRTSAPDKVPPLSHRLRRKVDLRTRGISLRRTRDVRFTPSQQVSTTTHIGQKNNNAGKNPAKRLSPLSAFYLNQGTHRKPRRGQHANSTVPPHTDPTTQMAYRGR